MSLVQNVITKYRKDGAVSLFRAATRSIGNGATDPIKYRLWQAGYLSLDDIYPPSYYQGMDRPEAMADADQLARLVLDQYSPESVIDLGCGVGRFSKPFWDRGVEVFGVDNSETAIENALVPSECVEVFDLRNDFEPPTKADVVLCLEVVEHLPETAADTIAQSIAKSAPIAIVTAATPGQGGKHHVNEQPHGYWIQKLAAAGMVYQAEDTEKLRESIEPQDLDWLAENLLVFKANGQF